MAPGWWPVRVRVLFHQKGLSPPLEEGAFSTREGRLVPLTLTSDSLKVNGGYHMGEHLGFRHSDLIPSSGSLHGTEPMPHL